MSYVGDVIFVTFVLSKLDKYLESWKTLEDFVFRLYS